jgi:hypothetical protein
MKRIRLVLGWLWELSEIFVDHLIRGLSFVLLVAAGVLGAWYVKDVRASRNSAGTYSLPAGNPVVTGTSISTTWANSTLSDLSTEMSDSKSRSGKGDFTAPVRGANGSAASPTWSFTNDTGTGYWLNAASDLRLSIGGVAKGFWNATGLGIGAGAAGGYPFDVSAINGADNARFGDKIALMGTAPQMGFNLHNDGSNKYMTTNIGGFLAFDLTNYFIFYTAPSGTAGNVATITERMRVNTSGVKFGNAGSTIQSLSFGSCVLNAGTPSTCTITVASGSSCSVSHTVNFACGIIVSGTTATATCGNGVAGTVTATCML